MLIYVEQNAYYDWVLTPEADVKPTDVSTDSQYQGFRLVKTLLPVETSTEIQWDDSATDRINTDREAAGLAPQSEAQIIVRHLSDGVLPYHCPPGSIINITCPDNPELGAALNAVFATAVKAPAPALVAVEQEG